MDAKIAGHHIGRNLLQFREIMHIGSYKEAELALSGLVGEFVHSCHRAGLHVYHTVNRVPGFNIDIHIGLAGRKDAYGYHLPGFQIIQGR